MRKSRATLIAALFSIASLTIVIISCKGEASDITANADIGILRGKCLEILEPVFMGRVIDPVSFEHQERVAIVPPNSVYTPFSLDDFRSDPEIGQHFAVDRILPAGTRLQVVRVWRLRAFEGDSIALTVRIVETGDGDSVADASHLLTLDWAAALADGMIASHERANLQGKPLLLDKFARLCQRERVDDEAQVKGEGK